ncbi:HP1 family phage holin [Arsenophonus endosymbiont of Crataerina pallida]|uniref:HP1 family phage holin n=1 Tax=Arsenophonus endosymbiont of Crataerina pallida TaxID=3066235 RepID=UPI0030CF2915
MRMPEKYSTPTAYLWGIMTTILGFFTLEECQDIQQFISIFSINRIRLVNFFSALLTLFFQKCQ